MIKELKSRIENLKENFTHKIDLTYITSRGNWYYSSWKGDERKSGGVSTNIGIHFFDMLIWIFGPYESLSITSKTKDTNAGILKFKNASVNWYLSNSDNLPKKIKEQNLKTFRALKINDEEIEFSDGFTDLHTTSYREILNGKGYGLKDAKNSIELVSNIRNHDTA